MLSIFTCTRPVGILTAFIPSPSDSASEKPWFTTANQEKQTQTYNRNGLSELHASEFIQILQPWSPHMIATKLYHAATLSTH